ncbi:hypothetical protein CERSUDRAFT_98944 [Gelatoporia subvermispora B]|uniref:Calpain catalytic domain-containing protein n=1 Tax=Ceriporiopsis subvermispora (strain B) TaxID=914234 RepID=M2R423_CERS8|nr:hypothetical protein CERSUDRAFT_98944 [Gelatoporia subvermispora B]
MSSEWQKKYTETKYNKAARAELDRDFDRAFRLYVNCVEDYLHLGRIASDVKLRNIVRTQAGKALERAEKLKAVKRDLAPVLKDHFSEQEQLYTLRISSLIHNTSFSLWGESQNGESDDVSQPGLSTEQKEKGALWSRLPGSRHPVYSSTIPLLPHEILQQRSSGVDGQLPTSPDGTLMCMSTESNKQLWPSLMEKAYMKLMGGYDFPGSNSGIDLHSEFQGEKTWERLLQGFTEGRCVLTLGTGERPQVIQDPPISLLPAHCYAALDLQETDGQRYVQILDTWSQSHMAQDGETYDDRPIGTDRTFRLSWDETCSTFDTIYLSWNSELYPNHLQFHGLWKRKEMPSKEAHSCHFPLRLRADNTPTNAGDYEVLILLTRHVRNIRHTSEFISLLVRVDDEHDSADYTRHPASLNVFQGEYTNNIHILSRVTLRPKTDNWTLSVIASYDGVYEEVGFTVSVYSHILLSWVQETTPTKYSRQINDSFSRRNAGGNQTYPTFLINPQYHLSIRPTQTVQTPGSRGSKAFLSVMAQTERSIPMNLLLVWSKGERVADPEDGSIAANSGPYSYGHAEMSHRLPAGEYTLIVSAFEPRHFGEFSLQVDCSHPFDLTPIPAEGAGMFCKALRGEWLADSAAGAPGFKNYRMNPSYELTITSQTQVMMRLQVTDSSSTTPLNVTLFRATQTTSLGAHVVTSGPYSDAVSGVVTPQITLQPGTYLAIPSTYSPGVERAFRLLVYSTSVTQVSASTRT